MSEQIQKEWAALPRQEKIDILVFLLEDKYKHLASVPNDEPLLGMLHDIFGIAPEHSPYCKLKVEELRVEHGYTQAQLGVALGYAKTWYRNFKRITIFNRMHAEKFGKLFGVEPEYFLK